MRTDSDQRQILEFRSDGETVWIQGTAEGLTWLARKCFVLVDVGRRQHFHLADYYVLTSRSKSAVLEFLPRHTSIWESLINRLTRFVRPDVSDKLLEFREYAGEVHLYGTSEGLQWLALKCLVLVDTGKKDALNMTEHHVLTQHSKPAVLALF